MLTVVLLRAEGRKTNASREVPSGACTWEATAKDGCGGAAAQGKERARGKAGADRSPVRTPGWAPAAGQRSVSSGAASRPPPRAPRAPPAAVRTGRPARFLVHTCALLILVSVGVLSVCMREGRLPWKPAWSEGFP